MFFRKEEKIIIVYIARVMLDNTEYPSEQNCNITIRDGWGKVCMCVVGLWSE